MRARIGTGLLVALGVGAMAWLAADRPAAASGAHGEARACHHCHADPHEGAGGTRCESCHTPADWAPSTFTVAEHTSFPLLGKHADVPCGTCHTDAKLTGLPGECAGCHVDPHRGTVGTDCATCHAPTGFRPVEGFDHARTGFEVDGPHAALQCADCHEGARERALVLATEVGCATCHAPSHGEIGACETCHGDGPFAAAAKGFDHRPTGFELHRRHKAQDCASCHPPDGPPPVDRCQSCHADPHSGQLGATCGDCHAPDRWRLVRFDHDRTGFPLRGRHFVAACGDCHTAQRWVGLGTECADCHAMDAARAPAAIPAHAFGRADCGSCHGTWAF